MTLQLLQPFDLADQATITWNPSAYPVARVTLSADRDFAAPVPLEAGATYMLIIVQDDTGGWTINWDPTGAVAGPFYWPSSVNPPTLSTAPGAIDIFAFITDGTNLYGVPQVDFEPSA